MSAQTKRNEAYLMSRVFVLVSLLIVMANIVGCNDVHGAKIYNHSDALIVLENAEDVFYELRVNGSIQLGYKLKEEYPAKHIIKSISERLKANGWEPLKYDYLNPGLPSSHVLGWRDHEDISSKPDKIVHQWIGDWKNKFGSIVRYGFMYSYPKTSERNVSLMQVIVIYDPLIDKGKGD